MILNINRKIVISNIYICTLKKLICTRNYLDKLRYMD